MTIYKTPFTLTPAPRVAGIDPYAAARSRLPGSKVARAKAALRAELESAPDPTPSMLPESTQESPHPDNQTIGGALDISEALSRFSVSSGIRNPNLLSTESILEHRSFYPSLPIGIDGIGPYREHPPVYDSHGNLVPDELLDEFGRLRRPERKPYKRRPSCSVFHTSFSNKRLEKYRAPARLPKSIYPEMIFVTKNGYYSAHSGSVPLKHNQESLTSLPTQEQLTPLPLQESLILLPLQESLILLPLQESLASSPTQKPLNPLPTITPISAHDPVETPELADSLSETPRQNEVKPLSIPLFCFITLKCKFPNNDSKYLYINTLVFLTLFRFLCNILLLRLSTVRLQN